MILMQRQVLRSIYALGVHAIRTSFSTWFQHDVLTQPDILSAKVYQERLPIPKFVHHFDRFIAIIITEKDAK